jgi:hypothetical protein
MTAVSEQKKNRVPTYTRRQFLEYELIMGNTPHWEARAQADEIAKRSPEMDMDQEMTWAEWKAGK